MNWKVLCLIAGLTLTASLSACSATPDSKNEVNPGGSPAAESTTPGGAMQKDDAMKKDGGAMKKDDAMKKDGGAMKKDDAMKNDSKTTKP